MAGERPDPNTPRMPGMFHYLKEYDYAVRKTPVRSLLISTLAGRIEETIRQGLGTRITWVEPFPDDAPVISTTTRDGTFSSFEANATLGSNFKLPFFMAYGFERVRVRMIVGVNSPKGAGFKARLQLATFIGSAVFIDGPTRIAQGGQTFQAPTPAWQHGTDNLFSFYMMTLEADAATDNAPMYFEIQGAFIHSVTGPVQTRIAKIYSLEVDTLQPEDS